jgi:hypothetical protein
MMRFFSWLWLLAVVPSCGQRSSDVAGGPCSYDTVAYPAVILEIDKTDSVVGDIQFMVDWGEGAVDTQWYSIANPNYIPMADIVKSGIVVGDTIQYLHYQITSGSCNPDLFGIRLQPFVQPPL